jgi:hypothetical protein
MTPLANLKSNIKCNIKSNTYICLIREVNTSLKRNVNKCLAAL